MYKVVIHVTLKPSVLDAEGKAVHTSLHTLGFDGVRDVRIGKAIELTLDVSSREQAETEVKQMCDALLVNPVVEQYRWTMEEISV